MSSSNNSSGSKKTDDQYSNKLVKSNAAIPQNKRCQINDDDDNISKRDGSKKHRFNVLFRYRRTTYYFHMFFQSSSTHPDPHVGFLAL